MIVSLWIWEAQQITTPTLTDWAAAGISRIYLKAAESAQLWQQFGVLLPVVKSLGMECWGWQYAYGDAGEEQPAIAALGMGADGWVIDAEAEYEAGGNAWTPQSYAADVRRASDKPVLLSSFGEPLAHPGMGWTQWDQAVDGYAPQLFPFYAGWPGTNAATITLAYNQHRTFTQKPLYPTGELWRDPNSPVVVASDVLDFLANCQAGGYDEASLYRAGLMDQACSDAVARIIGPPTPPPGPLDLEGRVAKIEAFLSSWRAS